MNKTVIKKIDKLLAENEFLDTIAKAFHEYRHGSAPDLFNYGEQQPAVEKHVTEPQLKKPGLPPERIKQLFSDLNKSRAINK